MRKLSHPTKELLLKRKNDEKHLGTGMAARMMSV